MIEKAAANIKLTKRATKLLKFYAEQKEGFRPALAYIQQETGIAANKISQIREILHKSQLIQYSDHTVAVQWKVIWLFSTLDPAMMTGSRKKLLSYLNAKALSMIQAPQKKTIGQINREKYGPPPKGNMTQDMEQFYSCIEQMTPEEELSLLRGIGLQIPDPIHDRR